MQWKMRLCIALLPCVNVHGSKTMLKNKKRSGTTFYMLESNNSRAGVIEQMASILQKTPTIEELAIHLHSPTSNAGFYLFIYSLLIQS